MRYTSDGERLAAPIIDPGLYGAVCSDYDGTLAMTGEIHLQARVDTIRAWGVPEENLPDDIIWQSNKYGSTLDVILTDLLADNGIGVHQEDIQAMIRYKERLIQMRAVVGAQAYPEAVNRIRTLAAPIGKAAIVTHASGLEINTFLDSYELRRAFDSVVCKDGLIRLGKALKPEPDPYLLAAGTEQLDVDPTTMLVIEDTPDGVRSGMRAGATVLALGNTTDKSEFEGMDAEAPHYFAPTWAEVVILDEPPGETLRRAA